MHKQFFLRGLLAVVVALAAVAGAQATVTMDYVTVGNPGNSADGNGAGGVTYSYQVGKYEVTNSQYVEFLNAKAADDPYGLYHPLMALGAGSLTPCRITRDGTPGFYTYSADEGHESLPVNYVDFWSAVRFANWMHNGQGNGDTETGSYTLTAGALENNTVVRNPGATVVIPSYDEWYKAAFYDAGWNVYYDYATSSDAQPANYFPDDLGDSANCYHPDTGARGLMPVGSYVNSASPYGTFDQTGNVQEWTDTIHGEPYRVVLDTPWNFWAGGVTAYAQMYPITEGSGYYDDQQKWVDTSGLGFRVAMLSPEPQPDVPGDANNDGYVNDADAKALAAHWGMAEQALGKTWWEMGDFDGDNVIGPKDAAILAANWGYIAPHLQSEAAPTAVPEPSAAMLLLLGFVTTILARRSR